MSAAETKPPAGVEWEPVTVAFAEARDTIHQNFADARTTGILVMGFGLWHEMSIAGTPLPRGMQRADSNEPLLRSPVVHHAGTAFLDSEADLRFRARNSSERRPFETALLEEGNAE